MDKNKKTVRLHISMAYTFVGDTGIDVPAELLEGKSEDEKIKIAYEYATEHIDEIPIDELVYVEDTDNIDDNDYDNSYLVDEHNNCIGDNTSTDDGVYQTLIKSITIALDDYRCNNIDLMYDDEYLVVMYHSDSDSFLINTICHKNDIDENIVIEIADGFNIGHAF